MKLLLTSVGSRGDIQPLFGLAVALQRRGHEVRVAVPPNFAAWSAELGLPFHSLGIDFHAFAQEQQDIARHPIHAIRVMIRLLQEQVSVQFRETRDLLSGVDRVVSSGLQFAVPALAEARGIPCHFAAFAPGLLPSPSHAPALLPWANPPKIVIRPSWWLMEQVFGRTVGPIVNRERARLGLRPIHSVSRGLLGEHVLLAVDPLLSGPLPDDVQIPFVQTGAWTLSSGRPVPAEVDRFLAEGPPPFFLGFGSIPDASPEETTRLFIDAVQAVGGRALISRGWANLGSQPLPRGFLAVGDLPHELVFPRVAAVLHHGGAGTTQTTARAGVPQIVVPHGADQFYWAHRVQRLGVAGTPLPKTKLNRHRLESALRMAMNDSQMRIKARQLGMRLRETDGVSQAVRILEQEEERDRRRAS
jgi:UDP:flavonoid glycosyltransferase YjiC (YdhE family)